MAADEQRVLQVDLALQAVQQQPKTGAVVCLAPNMWPTLARVVARRVSQESEDSQLPSSVPRRGQRGMRRWTIQPLHQLLPQLELKVPKALQQTRGTIP